MIASLTLVIQALFSLQLFHEHVTNADEHTSHITDARTIAAASSIRNLFRAIKEMKAASEGPLMTHSCILDPQPLVGKGSIRSLL